jgi:hypothetical protein
MLASALSMALVSFDPLDLLAKIGSNGGWYAGRTSGLFDLFPA